MLMRDHGEGSTLSTLLQTSKYHLSETKTVWFNETTALMDFLIQQIKEVRSLIVIIEGLVKKKLQWCSVQNAGQILMRSQHFAYFVPLRELQKQKKFISTLGNMQITSTSIISRMPLKHPLQLSPDKLKAKASFRYLMSHGQGHPESSRDQD